MTHPKRIAILGMMLESNAFAPTATEADFRARGYLEGAELWAAANREVSPLPQELRGFLEGMHATGPWEPLPILLTECEPAGPVEQMFFERTLERMLAGLAANAPVDGVYVANHGAMTATHATDPDGLMLEAIRDVVGPETPIVVTLDLHANISDRMVDNADLIVGYLTNPHVDMFERGEEAAHCMRAMLAGTRAESVLIRLPLTPASVTLLTAQGPYAELIDFGQRRKRESGGVIWNVSIFGGFVFGDTPENGVAIVVAARNQRKPARALAREIAERAWDNRHRFRKELTSIETAIGLANDVKQDPSAPAIIFSDAGDNPGGGGGGNTMWLLAALLEAATGGVLYGSFFDAPLAAEAHERGVGAAFGAVFNRDRETPFARRLEVQARVVALGDGKFTGRRGLYAGRAVDLGPCCVLAVGDRGDIKVVVISKRMQTADPMFFEQFGLDIGEARTVCVKSRGHFRAGFDPWFGPEQVYEVDTAGLTSPVLERLEWKGLPRPVYPLDPDTRWTPPA